MAKDAKSLEKSREIRKNIINKYGEVPTSIWKIEYGWGKHVIELDSRKQQAVASKKHEKMDYGENKEITLVGGKKLQFQDKTNLSKSFGMSSQNVRGKGAGLSTFPPDLAKRIVLFYSEKNETVLDPCAGHNSRMQITYELERNYIGYDICQEFIDFNEKVKKEITGKGEQGLLFTSPVTITLKAKSSEKLDEQDNSIDLIYTSPPYWDIEYYDDNPKQLGYKKSYNEFRAGIKRVISECYRVLKPGKYCAFNINDFRKNGILYTYHADIIDIFREVGFHMHDIIIVQWQSAIGACFASQIEERKITAKAHEYLVVGRK